MWKPDTYAIHKLKQKIDYNEEATIDGKLNSEELLWYLQTGLKKTPKPQKDTKNNLT